MAFFPKYTSVPNPSIDLFLFGTSGLCDLKEYIYWVLAGIQFDLITNENFFHSAELGHH